LLENVDEEGASYAVQYKTANLEDYNRYVAEFAPSLQKKGLDKWGGRFIAFRTLMKIVD